MKAQTKFFLLAGLFAVVVSVIYWLYADESAGFAMLLFMGLGSAFIGGYIVYRARGQRTFAEDDPDADPRDQAGEHIGLFPASSIWPLVMAIGLGIGLQGFVFGAWLFFFGTLLFVWAAIGLMMESRG
jgi:hypothetical protein